MRRGATLTSGLCGLVLLTMGAYGIPAIPAMPPAPKWYVINFSDMSCRRAMDMPFHAQTPSAFVAELKKLDEPADIHWIRDQHGIVQAAILEVTGGTGGLSFWFLHKGLCKQALRWLKKSNAVVEDGGLRPTM